MADELWELAERFLPAYLLPGARSQLLAQINDFPHDRGYFSAIDSPKYLQGDVWEGLVVINFETRDARATRGILISNSCDIAVENRAVEDQGVVFAPAIQLGKFADLLRHSGRDEEQVRSTLERLKKQHINNAFYLPAFGDQPESIVLLDNLHSMPLKAFWGVEKSRLLRLSDFGFWLFLLKLSIHFTRLHEDVRRDPVIEA
jgi:hypothetical protein